MPAALWTLIRLHFRGTFRRMLRGVRTPRGLTFLVLGLLMMFAWLGPLVYRAVHMPRTNPQLVRVVAPFAILGFCLGNLFSSFGDKAIAFTGAEVDFLFPGPFSRRSLLGYKIVKTTLGAFFTTLVFSVLFLRYSQSWFSCLIGIWLTIQFMQLFAMAVIMVGQTIGERAYSGTRRTILIAAAMLAFIAISPTLNAHLHDGPTDLMKRVQGTVAGQALLAPFNVFARAIAAPRMSAELAEWTAIGLVIDLGMLAVVIGLDANYLETAATISQRRYERSQRIRRGAGTITWAGGPRFRLPPLPWLGGVGPIAWRQLIGAARSTRALFTIFGILALIAGSFAYQRGGSTSSLQQFLGTAAWLNVVFISMLKFDFRDELDRLDLLRSLPIRPLAVATAEIVAPVLMLTAMQATLLIGVSFMFKQARPLLLCAAAFAIPFNILLTAVENLLFLMFPLRAVGLIAGDMQLFGRQMVVFMCKFLLLLTALTISAAFGLIGYIVGNRSWPAFGAAAWAGLSLVAMGTIPLLARVYARFDPSIDTPP